MLDLELKPIAIFSLSSSSLDPFRRLLNEVEVVLLGEINTHFDYQYAKSLFAATSTRK